MGNPLQETQIKLCRDITMLKLRYYTSLRELLIAGKKVQWSRWRFEMCKEELAVLKTHIARIQRLSC